MAECRRHAQIVRVARDRVIPRAAAPLGKGAKSDSQLSSDGRWTPGSPVIQPDRWRDVMCAAAENTYNDNLEVSQERSPTGRSYRPHPHGSSRQGEGRKERRTKMTPKSVDSGSGSTSNTDPIVETVSMFPAPPIPAQADAMTIFVTLPPGSAGTPPHRHSGPAFGYVVEGEMIFELEGEAERVVKAGESFWEPGGDVIHYRDANNLANAQTKFVVMMFGKPGEPMLVLVPQDELARRAHLRAPRADSFNIL